MTEQERRRIQLQTRCDLLFLLMQVAQATEGAEVWRALFAEGLRNSELELKSLQGDCPQGVRA